MFIAVFILVVLMFTVKLTVKGTEAIKNFHTDKVPNWLLQTGKVLVYGMFYAGVVLGVVSTLFTLFIMTYEKQSPQK